MNPYRIILADDHVLIRQGLRKILEEDHGLEVIGEAVDGFELLALLKKSTPDLVILDISMPNLRGIEAASEIRKRYPSVKPLMPTMHKDREHFAEAISAGIDGYLLKDNADMELFDAIERLRQGRRYVSPILDDELVEILACDRNGDPDRRHERLTTREREVLKLIAEGNSNKQIAACLQISVRTVEHHRARLMAKLNCKNSAQLVKYALQRRYV